MRELAQLEPEYLALFGIESLLQIEGAKKAILNLIRVYVEKREHLIGGAAAIIDQLIVNSATLK